MIDINTFLMVVFSENATTLVEPRNLWQVDQNQKLGWDRIPNYFLHFLHPPVRLSFLIFEKK